MSPLHPKAAILGTLDTLSTWLKNARQGHSDSTAMGAKLELATGRFRPQADAGKNLPCSCKGFATPDVNTKSLYVETDQSGVRAKVLL